MCVCVKMWYKLYQCAWISFPCNSVSSVTQIFLIEISSGSDLLRVGCHFRFSLVTLNAKSRPVAAPKGGAYSPGRGSAKKRSFQESSGNQVLDVTLVDKTGPVNVTLWGDCAATVETHLADFLRQHGAETSRRFIVALHNVRCVTTPSNRFNGTVVTSLKSLHTNRAPRRELGVAELALNFEFNWAPHQISCKFGDATPPWVVLWRVF